ncbi:MAG: hypothetical protein U1E29_07840 [Coriobacteriia bacterium]|nr:hypothetical protein [Coriobacteriia bacterium]
MADYVQISAQISEATRARLDVYARETGLKKGRLIEDAIQAHLDALDEVPGEYLTSHRVVVAANTWERIVAEMDSPSEPTPALRGLMRADAD